MRMRYASVCSGVEAPSLAWEGLGWRPVFFSEIEEFPCAVLKERWPEVPNLGDMTGIRIAGGRASGEGGEASLEEGVDVFIGGTPCFAAGEMVLTESGYVPIEEIAVGDRVVTHLGRLMPVTAVGSKQADIGELKILGRCPIRCTDYHPFYSFEARRDGGMDSPARASAVRSGGWEFAKAKDIPGRYVGRMADCTGSDAAAPEATEDTACLAGWYAALGSVTEEGGRTAVIAFPSESGRDGFRDRFEGRIRFAMRGNGDAAVADAELSDWLVGSFGERSENRRIPLWLYQSPLRDAFVEGYADAEGCRRKDGSIRFAAASKALAYGMADLMRTASVSMAIASPAAAMRETAGNQRGRYKVEWNENQRGIRHEEDRYATRGQWYRPGSAGTVYNITVDGDHSYVVNGVAVHNCQDVSVAGRRAGLVEGSRSRLAFDFVRLAYEMRSRWVVWENVPGVLSQNRGEDFAAFLSSLAGWDVEVPAGGWRNAGTVTNATDGNYGLAYRVLDAQHTRTPGFPHAVPQRRRRVFVVGHLGSWQRAMEVLADGESLQRTPPPRREKGQGLASHAQGGTGKTGGVVSEACYWNGQEVANTFTTRSILQNMPDKGQLPCIIEPVTYDSHPNDSRITEAKGVQQALTSRCGTGGGNLPLVQELVCYDPGRRDRCPSRMDESCFTLQAAMGEGGGNLPLVQERLCIDDQGGSIVHVSDRDIGCTIRATSHVPCVTEPVAYDNFNLTITGDVSSTLTTRTGIPDATGPRIVEPCVISGREGFCIDNRGIDIVHEPIVTEPVCFQQNQRDEIRLTGNDGKSCGAVMAEPGMKNQNYMAEPIALAGNTIGREAMNGGNGNGFETDGAMYTQTAMDIHAVCVPVATPNGEDVATTVDANYNRGCGEREGQERQVVCYPLDVKKMYRDPEKHSGIGFSHDGEPSYTVLAEGKTPGVAECYPILSVVRRLYPVECERLMGFPDGHTRIPWKGKPEEECPDGHRYKACGNSMCVNCIEWLGIRIEESERSHGMA